jgi:hypothetical protein
VALPTLILAAARNGNFVAIGGPGCALLPSCGAISFLPGRIGFTGLAVDSFAGLPIAPGTPFLLDTTITALADPASIDSIAPDPTLVAELGGLPQYSLINTGTPLPEPGTLGLLGGGLLSTALFIRRRFDK